MKRRIPEPIHPESAEREYQKFLMLYAKTYARLVREGVTNTVPDLKKTAAIEQPRMDTNIEDKFKFLFNAVDAVMARLFPDYLLRKWVKVMIGGVNQNSKKNIGRQVKKAFKKSEEPPTFEPFMKDNHLSPYFQNIVDENVGLIRSITTMGIPALKNELVALITADAPSKMISDALRKHLSPEAGGKKVNVYARARLIAVDQVGKLNGALEQYRQEQLGLKRYRWRTSGDSRVRKDHRALEGRIFTWKNPPIVDKRTGRRAHPKRDFRCRCWAEPLLDDIIDA
jgi:SPP1 gp7 family putative phage head morphogenesis protein